ncbi:MAG: site-specific integrase [Bacteroidetes bacterium]|nr:site-specific integrase [Rhodothermia bacterium]MCS7155079.1 site-specific integrase [Bacteroidota bacterium]MCX7907185.1 site-specific integrase [Bacteroidota bacterium]MDW8138744.1 phage integrase N-terminal SAM-like domain-containing protein [Bacteroidota bacterium]MDW8286079.1 phage integrase N-terminal SAM-like domain-containing protein [Bacteroidota bacterium]
MLDFTNRELDLYLERFESEYLAEASPETRGTYRRALNTFRQWFARQKGAFRFRETDVERYRLYLVQTKNLADVSVSTYLTALRRFCQYLVQVGLLAENPARRIRGNRRPGEHRRRYLELTELEALLEAIPKTDLMGLRDRALVGLMAYSGVTEIEISRARILDLERHADLWWLRVQPKGYQEKTAVAELHPQSIRLLEEFLQAWSARQPLEPGWGLIPGLGPRNRFGPIHTRALRKRVEDHLKRAGLAGPGRSPHSLVYTAVRVWLEDLLRERGKTMPDAEIIESLKELVYRRMHHQTLETTLVYLRQIGIGV